LRWLPSQKGRPRIDLGRSRRGGDIGERNRNRGAGGNGNVEITVNIVEVRYKPNGKNDSKEDGVYIFKYFENTPVRSLIDNCVLPHA